MIDVRIDLNDVKRIFEQIYKIEGFSYDLKDFETEFELDLNNDIREQTADLKKVFEAIFIAIKRVDFLTVKALIVYARVYLMNLASFFLNLRDDIANFLVKIDYEPISIELSMADEVNSLEVIFSIPIDFNRIKNLVDKLTCFNQIDPNNKEYRLDYNADLNAYLAFQLDELAFNAQRIKEFLAKGEIFKAYETLASMKLVLNKTFEFFENLVKDFEELIWSDEAKFPTFTEDFKIPEGYDVRRI